MIVVAPGAPFEALTDAFASGLEGTLGVRIRDGEGNDVLARTTLDIFEDTTVGSSAVYRRSFDAAPEDAGQFWLIWDDETSVRVEELRVTSSIPAAALPGGRDLCELADVLRYVPGYVPEPETDETLQVLITAESRDIHQLTGREFVAIPDLDPRLFAIDAYAVQYGSVPIGDCAEVASVAVTAEDGEIVDELADDEFSVLPYVREEWAPIRSILVHAASRSSLIGPRPRLLQVSGTWGYPQVPENIRQACAKRVILRYLSDVAAEGTAFSQAVDESGINLGALLRSSAEAIGRHAHKAIA